MDIRQSPQYASYVKSIGWKVETIGKWNAFVKHFPFVGSFIKIQRISSPIPWDEIEKLHKKHRSFKTIIEPDLNTNIINHQSEIRNLTSPYSPTKTIHINLKISEDSLFNSFSSSARRAIRRAEKNNVIIEESNNIADFIKLKSKHYFDKFLIHNNIKKLWQAFAPDNALVLKACRVHSRKSGNLYNHIDSGSSYSRIPSGMTLDPQNENTIASVLILFHQKTAYYWLAASTKEGNSVAAPSLLVWEALKLSKEKKCEIFDFEGIYDERLPKALASWKGFTKFKQGFGGKEIEYPRPAYYKP